MTSGPWTSHTRSAHRRKLNKMTGFPPAKVRKSGLRHDDGPEETRFDLCAKIRHRDVFVVYKRKACVQAVICRRWRTQNLSETHVSVLTDPVSLQDAPQ
jgi:hypothetical protein